VSEYICALGYDCTDDKNDGIKCDCAIEMAQPTRAPYEWFQLASLYLGFASSPRETNRGNLHQKDKKIITAENRLRKHLLSGICIRDSI
jgi:hypothetical protein